MAERQREEEGLLADRGEWREEGADGAYRRRGLPCRQRGGGAAHRAAAQTQIGRAQSELQSPMYLVCRLLLEKHDTHDLNLAGRDLSGRFAVTSRSHHSPLAATPPGSARSQSRGPRSVRQGRCDLVFLQGWAPAGPTSVPKSAPLSS